MSGAPLRTKVIFRGPVRNTQEPDDGRVKRVTLESGVLAGEVESELVLRATLSDRRALLVSDPSPDGASVLIEIDGLFLRWDGRENRLEPAPWVFVSSIEQNVWWNASAMWLSPVTKFSISHPRLFANEVRFANKRRVVEWLEVEIDAALEKRLLSGR